MDGSEHDAMTSTSQGRCHQKLLCAEKRPVRGVGDLSLISRFEQAQAANEDALVFFHEALRCQNTSVQIFLESRANQGNIAASLLLRAHYLSLLLDIRAGDEHATIILHTQVVKQGSIAHELLIELVAQGDRIAHQVLYTSYDFLLEQLLKGDVEALTFFRGQLQRQNEEALAFLSERAAQDARVYTTLLYPYYYLLLPLAIGSEQGMTVFWKQLQNKDEGIQAFLVQQIEEGSDDAFRIVWECYRVEIYRYVKSLVGDVDLAEELIGAIFTKVWRSLPTRNKGQKMHIRAWLYSVAYSETLDYLRKRRVRTSISLAGVDANASVPGPENGVCERDCLKEALLRLSKRARKCVLMADVEGYSTLEIARALRVQQSTVTSYLARTRAKLRDYYLQAVSQMQNGTKLKSPDSGKYLEKKQGTGKPDANGREEGSRQLIEQRYDTREKEAHE